MTAWRKLPALARVGLVLAGLLVAASLVGKRVDSATWTRVCPLGADALDPDTTVCESVLGGLGTSLFIGVLAALAATVGGLAVALGARLAGGLVEKTVMRVADAFFALPDVLVLMVFGFALQTLGDLNPALRIGDVATMVGALALVGWAAPARMLRDRLATLEGEEYVTAARGLGATRARILVRHLVPPMRGFLVAVFLARVPSAIVAESTVSFLGVVRMHTLTLGRYLGTRYEALSYQGGAAVVVPAWLLLLAIVVATRLVAYAGEER